ncbi:dnaJ homolog subfamily C member 21-like [Leptinotarsa decemlineata]|uniref:dnaJ homolog subfamily C member 21-like n=1 Tax=Leptinotarsa decemlineata TaxID=7539 RepID=UPI003D30CFA7
MMECHYKVLGISRNADDAEIRSAYRKLALKWHPDKNLDQVELAKKQFQIIKRAYDILCEKQKRADYDKSHEEFPRYKGADYDESQEQFPRDFYSDFVDKGFDVSQYLTTTCFKGYGDDKNGFYCVYRTFFDGIIKEDMNFMKCKNKYRDVRVPRLGNSFTDYEKVKEFYAYWLNYSTKHSYVWDFHRKEHNQKVQNLVAFVRERDERVLAQKKLREQKLAKKKKRGELSHQEMLRSGQKFIDSNCTRKQNSNRKKH